MKKLIGTFASLILVVTIFAQKNPTDLKPTGMEFVPAGSFEVKIPRISETKLSKVTVEAFWMSNEITNAEYRKFVDWAKKNPNQKLYQAKYSIVVVSDPKKGTMKDTVIVNLNPIEVSTIISDLIDPICLERVNKQYKDYFTDSKYDNFPVVGVSFKMAEYYCIWKTTMENEKRKEQGLPIGHAFRLPLETEWEYVAQNTIKNKVDAQVGKIQNVNEGSTNEFGLSHLDNNVSEWVTPNRGETGLIRGGSWKTETGIFERQLVDPNSKEPYVGFRIVQSYVPTQDFKKIK